MKELSNQEIIEFIREKTNLFSQNDCLRCTEISDGNINYVYRIENKKGKSVVLKYASEHIRTSGNFLNVDRSRIEIKALLYEHEMVSNSTPEIYYYDFDKHLFIMEDLRDFKNLRYALMNEEIYPSLKNDINNFLIKTLLLSTDLVIDPLKKKELVKEYINPMLCQISERLVFTEPYDREKNNNVLSAENKSFFESELYDDQELKLIVAKAKNNFKNNAQCLLHGDLHTGSIFVKKGMIKVLDPEFAFYGPAGYDIGNVIANLLFAYIRSKNTTKNRVFMNYIKDTIAFIIDRFKNDGLRMLKKYATDRTVMIDGYFEYYINRILIDTAIMTGTELIRRTVGDAKVKDIQTIKNKNEKLSAERDCIIIAKRIMKNANLFTNGKEYIKFLNEYEEIGIRADEGMGFLLKYENVAWYENGTVKILDRRKYPMNVKYVTCNKYQEVSKAIKDMVTQSAGPYTAATMGMALAAFEVKDKKNNEIIDFLNEAKYDLSHARPTTTKKMESITDKSFEIAKVCLEKGMNGEQLVEQLKLYAYKRINDNYHRYEKTAKYLADLIPYGGSILTQCFGETIIGTLLKELKRRGNPVKIYCAETRPYFQGARLTASVANEMGFEVTDLCDNMIASAMENKKIDLFTSAADVITMDGHVINKVGTSQIAILCQYYNVPYYVTGEPDLNHKNLSTIEIESRNPELALKWLDTKIVENGVQGYYPAFDITKPNLIKGVITDLGVFKTNELNKYYE